MTSKEVRTRIEQSGIVAAIRVYSAPEAIFAVDAVVAGGIEVIEITLTVPQATKVIANLVKDAPNVVVGAGGIMDVAEASECLDAGAQFLTSDGLKPSIIEFAVKKGVIVFPGALTPTEVMTAWEARADFVKVVPCAQIGGENYISSLRKMFPDIPLIAAGGVTEKNASKFIFAGAAALGIGRELLPPEALRHRQAGRISNLAKRFLSYVKSGRGH
jgi:2-dehydro-3-deoxyphosphogluconate aldolase / (4S)-4-hydroxy-2-oxoglutarate aldolase